MLGQINEIKDRIKDLLARQKQVIVAIDGGCAAGTEELARMIAEEFDCNLFHTPDFFLPEMSDEGIYLDCERLRRVILEPVRRGIPFFFRPIGKNPMEAVVPKRLNFVEGTYSLHPKIRDAYDLKIILRTDSAQRQQFIKRLEPEKQMMYAMQIMPAEAMYFNLTPWDKYCDFILETTAQEI